MSTTIGHNGDNEFWAFVAIMGIILIAMGVFL